MKKLLGIVVLCLLLSGNAFANKIPDMTNSVWVIKDGKKYTFKFNAGGQCSYTYRDIFMKTVTDCQWSQNGDKIKITGNDNYWTRKITVSGYDATGSFSNINGRVDAFKGKASYIENWLTASSSASSGSSSNNKIAQSKKICKELGFKTNSEKFADCALKMMALQFQTGSKVSNNDGSSTQKIVVQQQDDFDIGDFFFGLQKIVDDNYRSTNNNSSNQGTNCTIRPKAWGADMVCR
jgi:hypothetical protein